METATVSLEACVFSCVVCLPFVLIGFAHIAFTSHSLPCLLVAVAGVVRTSGQDEKIHFITMAKYARSCLKVFKKLVRSLEVLLGPDTSLLDIRFGLHR